MLTKIQTLLARVPLWIWCVLVFAAAVGIRVHWIQQKEGFHLDEGATVVLSSYNRYGFLDAFPDGKELSGDEVRNLTCGNEFGLKNLGEDLVGLRADNRDSPHTNFYYSLFRIAIFDADSTDIKTVIARGCARCGFTHR